MVFGRSRARGVAFVAGLIVPAIALSAYCLAQGDSKPAPAETAGKKFKNIKVFKNLPADQLIPVMRQFNASLGVRCDACHIINPDHSGFDKDDKPMKGAARAMVVMLNDLNKKQKALGGRATCFMCHHGHPEPEMRPGGEEHHEGERR